MGLITGGLWLFCAAMCLFVKNKKREFESVRKKRLVFCAFFGVFGALGVVGQLLSVSLLSNASTLLATGLICIWVLLYSIQQSKKCSHEVNALYTGFNTYTSTGQKSYAPIFEYDYEGVHYVRQACESYSFNSLKKRFQIRDRLNIYINPEEPESCISTQKIARNYAICGVLGASFIVLFIVTLF